MKKISDYTKWTHGDLIRRINELEKAIGMRMPNVVPKATNTPELEAKLFAKTRHVALKFSYFGWSYNGLAVQKEPTPLPTVEGTILGALARCRLIPQAAEYEPDLVDFSRAGRTDKGVSARSQVISLKVRSLLDREQQMDPTFDEQELKYTHMLNSLLPDDIRFYQECLRPPVGFDARFSCKSRRYRYFFFAHDPFGAPFLNIDKMREAAALFQGDHDFRNFCKVDGSKQITNFVRTIYDSQIIEISKDAATGQTLYAFDLHGTAFLWHQVRSMIAVLFLIGQGHEEPRIIDELFDIDKYPGKPGYVMAEDFPLVLWDITYGADVAWQDCSRDTKTLQSLSDVFYNQWYATAVRESIQHQIGSTVVQTAPTQTHMRMVTGGGLGSPLRKYVPLKDKPRGLEPEEVNMRFRKRKIRDD
ncbi:hypothetical protein CANCADRAFT_104682 [Tortispora caseinolytica NRRL Y-17796]|uniref:tRNA pseudouridine synthase n=1 Tax=Tortispora caseinolytica NRRL Y-17796 TaxID=767744 RepID=A0A1E4TEU1_9ASCO|nr:hypothetical protein CANCADRAFT_104682 [Tortispora caseinolytica NRRL Y-17796]